MTKNLLYITYFFSFIGAAFFSISIAGFALFPFRILMLLILLIVLFLILRQKKVDISLFNNKYFLFLLMWWFYSILQLLWSYNIKRGLEKIIFFTLMIMLIIFTSYLLKKAVDYIKLFHVIIFSVVVTNVFGWINFFTGYYLQTSRLKDQTLLLAVPYNVPTSVFTNENDFGIFLAIFLPFFLAIMEYYRSIRLRFVVFLLLISNIALIYLSTSRGALLSMFLGFIILLLFTISNKKGYIKLIYTTLLFSVSIFWGIISFTKIKNSIAEVIYDDVSTQVRINLIKNGFSYLNSTYGFGIGLGNFETYMQNWPIYPTGNIINIHNWIAEIFVESGYLIGILYLWFYFALIKNIFFIYKLSDNSHYRMIAKALMTSLLVMIVASSVPSSFFQFRPHWILLAFSINFLKVYKKTYSSIK